MSRRTSTYLGLWVASCAFWAMTSRAMVGSAIGQETSQRFAVLAGVEDYDHNKLERLEYAEDDAQALAEVLGRAGYQVTLLCDSAGKSDISQRPTKANINGALKRVLDRVTKRDTVVVGLMGHGIHFGGGGDSYFCPQDARPLADRTDTLLSLGNLYQQLDDSGAGVKMLFVDACRNDPDPGRGRGVDADTAPRPPQGVAVLFSCSKGERAYEHASFKHGIFTHFLLEGLKGQARDSDGDVTFQSAAAYVMKNTARTAPALITGRQQSPNLKADLSGAPAVLVPAHLLRGSGTQVLATTGRTETGTSNQSQVSSLPKLVTNSVGMKLWLIPAGEFMMGSPETEADRKANEQQHRVQITKPFYIGKYEVTQGEFKAVMGRNPSHHLPNRYPLYGVEDTARYPVEQVTWKDAVEFCNRLSASERRKYRLPTEAEWEYTCRAGTTTTFNFSDKAPRDLRAPYVPCQVFTMGPGNTVPVGSFTPNAFGICDLHGNVMEWCADWYQKDYYENSPLADPLGPPVGEAHVIRGGSYNYDLNFARSAWRGNSEFPDVRIGFRVVLDANASASSTGIGGDSAP